MRGNDTVIAELNEALREELTAINQYFVHAEMCHNWGYHRLGSYIRKQSIDEMKHAEQLIERVLFLDGTPKMEYLELNLGGDVRAQIEADLTLEVNAVAMYNKAIQVAREAGRRPVPRAVLDTPQGRGGACRLARDAASPDHGDGIRTVPHAPGPGAERIARCGMRHDSRNNAGARVFLRRQSGQGPVTSRGPRARDITGSCV